MPIKLFVNYEDKEKVKFLGAKWSKYKNSWYLPVDKKENIDYCYKWLSKDQQECKFFVPYNNLYLYKTKGKCYKCKNDMELICFGSIRYEENLKVNYVYTYITLLSDELMELVEKLKEENIFYEKRYSYTEKKYYYMNVCSCCNSHQGDNYMFFKHESPFINLEVEGINEKKLNFEFDIPMTSKLISLYNYIINIFPDDYFEGCYYDEDYYLIKKKIKKD